MAARLWWEASGGKERAVKSVILDPPFCSPEAACFSVQRYGGGAEEEEEGFRRFADGELKTGSGEEKGEGGEESFVTLSLPSCPHRYNLEEEERKVGVRRSLSHLEAGSSSHLSSFLSAPFSPLGLVKILFGTVAPLPPPWLLRRRPLFPPRFPLGFFLPTSAFHVLL